MASKFKVKLARRASDSQPDDYVDAGQGRVRERPQACWPSYRIIGTSQGSGGRDSSGEGIAEGPQDGRGGLEERRHCETTALREGRTLQPSVGQTGVGREDAHMAKAERHNQ